MDTFKVDVSIDATGDDFSASKWEADANIACHLKYEKGELFRFGPRKGQPIPFGSGIHTLDENAWKEFFTGDKPEFWSRLKEIIESAKKLGATDMHFLVVVAYPDQCNLSFDEKALKFISDLGLRVDFTAYMNDGDDTVQGTPLLSKVFALTGYVVSYVCVVASLWTTALERQVTSFDTPRGIWTYSLIAGIAMILVAENHRIKIYLGGISPPFSEDKRIRLISAAIALVILALILK